jgi:hypothetical protein
LALTEGSSCEGATSRKESRTCPEEGRCQEGGVEENGGNEVDS